MERCSKRAVLITSGDEPKRSANHDTGVNGLACVWSREIFIRGGAEIYTTVILSRADGDGSATSQLSTRIFVIADPSLPTHRPRRSG